MFYFQLFLCRLNECSWRHIAIQILYVRPCVRPLKFRLTFFKLLLFEHVCFNYNQTWIIGALWEPSHYDVLGGHMTIKVKGHLRSNYPFVRPLKFRLTFFKLLLFEQVRFNYVQPWIIGALWEPSHYDALGGHMTRSKVIWGQIVIVISVNLFQISPVRTGSLQIQPNLVHRCTMGTFSICRSSRSHDKVKGHWR